MAKAPPSISVTSTRAMVRAAEARGVATGEVLNALGVTQEFVEDPDARLPGPTVLAIWNALRERTGDPTLQLIAPTCLPWGAYRVIDYLVNASATVGDGVLRFVRFFGLIADAVVLTVERERDDHVLSLLMADGRPVPPVYVDYVFAALVTRIRMRIHPGLRVRGVELRVPEPPTAARYAEVFEASVRFGMPADRLSFSNEDWETPLRGADAALAHLMEEHARVLAQRISAKASGFRAEVQKTIASAPPEAGSAEDVARALHVSVRTLQRKLVANGTTFREVSDTVRGQLATEYLTDTSVSIAEVAFLLGFSEQSSFNRAFRRWTGESPGQWRRRRARTAVAAAPQSA